VTSESRIALKRGRPVEAQLASRPKGRGLNSFSRAVSFTRPPRPSALGCWANPLALVWTWKLNAADVV
jgi:hypothetical protein